MNFFSTTDTTFFQSEVKNCYLFLEKRFGMNFCGVSETKTHDPRDSGIVARYSQQDITVYICWSKFEKSITITIKFDGKNLTRDEKYIYFEPFLDFISKGIIKPIVPYVYNKMSTSEISSLIKKREKLFEHGFLEVMKKVAQRLEDYFDKIQSISEEQIKSYHLWIRNKKQAS